MSIPTAVEWSIGDNVHGQPIRLRRIWAGNRMEWQIHQDAADQRDDATWIGGLTPAQIKAMAEAVETFK